MGKDTNETQDLVIANRGDAIPIIHITPDGVDPTPTIADEAKSSMRSMIKDKIKDTFGGGDGSTNGSFSLQDRMFAAIMSQIIPTDGAPEEEEEAPDPAKVRKERKEARAKRQQQVVVDRPDFGPRLMAVNFRRFNARVGALFAAQKGVEDLLVWKYPSVTLTVLAGHTFICLNPAFIPVIPLCIFMFAVLVPAFLARHPTPDNDPRIEPSYVGPPTAPPVVLKPAPDLSADFWRNARDVQNLMEDTAHGFDLMNLYVTPLLNWSDEAVTSFIFLSVALAAGTLLVTAHLIPYNLVLLVGGWAGLLAGNPHLQKVIASVQGPDHASTMLQRAETLQTTLRNWIEHDIVLDAPEIRQVEIFELQRFRGNDPEHHTAAVDNATTPANGTAPSLWEPWLFSPSPYVPLSQARVAGHRPKGTQFFEDVAAPAGWTWKEKKWNLDLVSREWVEQRMITGVEVETQGDRWVYDIPADELEVKMVAEGGWKSGSARRRLTAGRKDVPRSGWEEGTGKEKRGEWRRRRWTRLVIKKSTVWDGNPPGEEA